MRRLFLILFVGVLVFGLWFRYVLGPADASKTKEESFTIASGESIGLIASHLYDRGLIRSPWAFKWYARVTGVAGALQAGSFAVSPSESSSAIIAILHSGKSQEFYVTIPEGMETEHDKAVAANLAIDAQIFKEDPEKLIKLKEEEMAEAVKELDFETAAILRDEIIAIKAKMPKPPKQRKLKKGERLI
jgi:cell division protein YceG involved in septum cleavage